MGVSETRPLTPAKQARKALDLRLCDVAERAGCSIGLVSMVESGYIPPAATRGRIAKALGQGTEKLWPEVCA